MGRFYNSYAEALQNNTACQFSFPFSFTLPTFVFPPPIPTFDFVFILPSPPFYCPLD